jgi:hypothetical protein
LIQAEAYVTVRWGAAKVPEQELISLPT